VRILLSLVVSLHWLIRQLDVKNAFLHSNLIKEVYMKQAPGFVHSAFLGHVCKLKKAEYGLNKGAWFHCFSSFILSYGFVRSHPNPSMFNAHINSHILILLLYVSDIVLMVIMRLCFTSL